MTFRILDLFSGAGGAAMGYHQALDELGVPHRITGIDNRPQPRYPFRFIQADALEYLAAHGSEYDFIHASPPCQFATEATKVQRAKGKEYPNLIPDTRRLLQAAGKPYVIENVPGAAKWMRDPLILNGAMFGMLVHRVRLFECNPPAPFVLLPQLPRPVKMGRAVQEGDIVQPVGNFINPDYARRQMGCEWMARRELSQAIPPAYTRWLMMQLYPLIRPEAQP